MDLTKEQLNFNVTLYNNFEKISDTLSKCRVRIFYKYFNRNRTYISDEFAQDLINSLPYTPIKGIFDSEEMDYEDHGDKNSKGKIYGIVPENPNFAWETHLDDDGVMREYACADVLIFTALYPEASLIPEKSQSMEIYKKTLKGEWRIWEQDGQPYYYFKSGGLVGLQVLGDEVEPCFEGSAFFSLYKEAQDFLKYLKNSSEKKNSEKQESEKMDKNIFRLSDSTKFDLIWQAVSDNHSKDIWITDIFDDYALCYDYEKHEHFRAYYTKDNEAETVTINKIETCYIVDVTEVEKNALEGMKAIGSYSEIEAKLSDNETKIAEYEVLETELRNTITELNSEIETYKNNSDKSEEEIATEIENYKKSISELESSQETLNAEIENYKATITEKDAEIVRLNSSITDITNEKLELEEFKKNSDNAEKQSILDEFSAHLSEEKTSEFAEKMGDYSVEDFKKEVCFAAYESDTSIFSQKDNPDNGSNLIFKNTNKNTDSGVIKLLNKYKGGNK